jgi:hypothetical protein
MTGVTSNLMRDKYKFGKKNQMKSCNGKLILCVQQRALKATHPYLASVSTISSFLLLAQI